MYSGFHLPTIKREGEEPALLASLHERKIFTACGSVGGSSYFLC